MTGMMKETEEAARTLGVQLRRVAVHGPDEFHPAFPHLPASTLTLFSCFQVRCSTPNEDALLISQQSIGSP